MALSIKYKSHDVELKIWQIMLQYYRVQETFLFVINHFLFFFFFLSVFRKYNLLQRKSHN